LRAQAGVFSIFFSNSIERSSIHMASKIRPLQDRVIVKRTDEAEQMRGGLYIPDTAKEKPQEGEVIAAGPGKVENGNRIELTVKVGDKVLFGKYAGTEVKLDGEEYLIMREDDILGIIEGAAKGKGK
jgi:chaperonin GroES